MAKTEEKARAGRASKWAKILLLLLLLLAFGLVFRKYATKGGDLEKVIRQTVAGRALVESGSSGEPKEVAYREEDFYDDVRGNRDRIVAFAGGYQLGDKHFRYLVVAKKALVLNRYALEYPLVIRDYVAEETSGNMWLASESILFCYEIRLDDENKDISIAKGWNWTSILSIIVSVGAMFWGQRMRKMYEADGEARS